MRFTIVNYWTGTKLDSDYNASRPNSHPDIASACKAIEKMMWPEDWTVLDSEGKRVAGRGSESGPITLWEKENNAR